jgi:glycosyltransferase involved in cell wall biosynthesis
MKLTCVLATRNRPQMLIETVKETLRHIVLEDTRILVAADADDHGTLAALHAFANEPRVVASVRDREDDLGSKFSRALKEAPADVYSHMVDYAPFTTPGFDRNLIEIAAKIPDNIGVINCRMPTLCFTASQGITHGLAEKLGYIYPPYFPYWFVDHWIDDIARLIGRLFYVDNAVDTSRRPGTQELREPGWWATFFDVMAPYRRQQAERIIRSDDFASPEWQKDLAVAAFPMHEHRSKWINDQVRGQEKQMVTGIGAGPPDERYARVKARAVDWIKMVIAEMEAEAATAAFKARSKVA